MESGDIEVVLDGQTFLGDEFQVELGLVTVLFDQFGPFFGPFDPRTFGHELGDGATNKVLGQTGQKRTAAFGGHFDNALCIQ